MQRQPFEDHRPQLFPVVNMAAADGRRHFVQDISDRLEGSWRWTQRRPTVIVRVGSNENLKFSIDFTLPEVTFQDTGPVTLSFFVNDHCVDRIRYTHSGRVTFEKPVPAEWVKPGQDTTLAAEIDKMWTSKEDGTRLGFILSRIGLIQ